MPALAREGYSWGQVSLTDTLASLRWPGAPALARKDWRMGAREISASLLKPLYFRQARQFLPALRPTDPATKAGAGVRVQAWDADRSLLDDFAVDQLGAVTLLRNAPSLPRPPPWQSPTMSWSTTCRSRGKSNGRRDRGSGRQVR